MRAANDLINCDLESALSRALISMRNTHFLARQKRRGWFYPPRATENKRDVIRPGRHCFGALSCNLKAATNRVSRSVSLKKIKISRHATRVPYLKEVLCIISRSLRSKRVAWEKKTDKNIENLSKRFNYSILNQSFSIRLSLFLPLFMLVNKVNAKFIC